MPALLAVGSGVIVVELPASGMVTQMVAVALVLGDLGLYTICFNPTATGASININRKLSTRSEATANCFAGDGAHQHERPLWSVSPGDDGPGAWFTTSRI